MADKLYNPDEFALPPEQVERAERAIKRMQEKFPGLLPEHSRGEVGGQAEGAADLAEWLAVEPEGQDGWMERHRENARRQQQEIADLMAKFPEMGVGRARMLSRALSMVDNLAASIADVMGWEHTPATYEHARSMTLRNSDWENPAELQKILNHGPDAGMAGAYVNVVEARRDVLELGVLTQAIERLALAGEALLHESPQKRRKEDAKAAAVSGWEWLEPVRLEAFKRREADLKEDPVKYKGRAKSIRKMLKDIRAMYDDLGRARNVTLHKDDAQAIRTINSWFILAKRG